LTSIETIEKYKILNKFFNRNSIEIITRHIISIHGQNRTSF